MECLSVAQTQVKLKKPLLIDHSPYMTVTQIAENALIIGKN